MGVGGGSTDPGEVGMLGDGKLRLEVTLRNLVGEVPKRLFWEVPFLCNGARDDSGKNFCDF